MPKKHFFFFLLVLFFSFIVLADSDYNDPLTRSIGDSIYCMVDGNCTLDWLTVYDLSVIGDVFNVTMNLVSWNITENFNVGGNLIAENITASNMVGIGTTSPEAMLQVNDSKTSESQVFKVVSDDANVYQILLEDNTAAQEWGFYTLAADTLVFKDVTDTRDVMSLDGTGNVGIGTASPAHEMTLYDSTDAALQFISDTTGATATDGTTIGLSADDLYIINREEEDIFFKTNNINRMKIQNDGLVGIGETAPNSNLHIKGSGNTNQYFLEVRDSDDKAAMWLYSDASGDNELGIYDTTGVRNIAFKGGDNKDSWFRNGQLAVGKTSVTAGYDLDVNGGALFGGNVGIGVTTPGQKLTVNGDVNMTSTLPSLIMVDTDGTSFKLRNNAGVLQLFDLTSGGYVPFAIKGGANSNTLYVDGTNDKVGIGTTSPSYPLTFAQANGDKITLFDDSHYGWGLQANELQNIVPSATQFFTFGHGTSASFTEVMRITGDGNVGIGTTTSGQKLTVNGDVNITSNTILGSPTNIQNLTMFTNPSGNPACCGVMDDMSWGCIAGVCS